MNYLKEFIKTPWKGFNELENLVLRLPIIIFLYMNGVDIKRGFKFYGFPVIQKHAKSSIKIGSNFENRNSYYSNPLGLTHPTIFCTWDEGAQIEIGDDVGISGGSIVASKKITIGDGTIVGANSTIIDTDFHPIKSNKRRYQKIDVPSREVIIGKNVFIGMNCIVLKGSYIPDNTVVPAGSVVRSDTYKK